MVRTERIEVHHFMKSFPADSWSSLRIIGSEGGERNAESFQERPAWINSAMPTRWLPTVHADGRSVSAAQAQNSCHTNRPHSAATMVPDQPAAIEIAGPALPQAMTLNIMPAAHIAPPGRFPRDGPRRSAKVGEQGHWCRRRKVSA